MVSHELKRITVKNSLHPSSESGDWRWSSPVVASLWSHRCLWSSAWKHITTSRPHDCTILLLCHAFHAFPQLHDFVILASSRWTRSFGSTPTHTACVVTLWFSGRDKAFGRLGPSGVLRTWRSRSRLVKVLDTVFRILEVWQSDWDQVANFASGDLAAGQSKF